MGILPGRARRATPYLYSPHEISNLMSATAIVRGSHLQATYRTLIGVLAATGMRVGEAIGLDIDDFDAINGLLTIRNGKFGKMRELPLHPTVVTALQDYLRRNDRPHQAGTSALLSCSAGRRLRYKNVMEHSGNCCAIAVSHHVRPHAGRGSMISGMASPSIPSLMATRQANPGPAWRSCQPISVMSTLPIPTGIFRPHRNCWGWPAIGLSATLEVTHDRTCHDFAGVLH